MAYALNKDIIEKDGKISDTFGAAFCLGSFDDQLKAEQHAKEIIQLTQHPAIIAVKYGFPILLKPTLDPKTVTTVTLDAKGKLIEMDNKQYQEDIDKYEERMRLQKELEEEDAKESDPDDIEHMKRACYLMVKNKATYEVLQKQADEAKANYEKRLAQFRDHYRRHPEHEEKLMPYLKKKLLERGELPTYEAVEAGYLAMRSEVLED